MSTVLRRPFFPYFGSAWMKTRNGFYPCPRPGQVVVEPFAGAAGFSTFIGWPDVVLVDLDESVVMTWQYLFAATPREILSLPDIEPGQSVGDLATCEEARILIGWWLGRARHRPAKAGGKWLRDYPGQGRFWSSGVRERIARQLSMLKGWSIHHCDYREAPAPANAFRFVDAPYNGPAGANYRCNSRALNYCELRRWCRSHRGTVVVCEQQGADWLPFWAAGTVKATRGHSREAVCVLVDGVPQRQLAMRLPEVAV